MSLYKRPGSTFWWYYIRHPHGGGSIRKSTGETDKKKAQRIYDEEKARVWKTKVNGRQLSDALAAWYELKDRSINDRNAVKQILREHGDSSLSEITAARIQEVFKRKSNGTYNRLVAIVRASLNVAHSRGWLGEVPKLPRKTEAKIRVRWITTEEASRLLAELPDHLREMAAFSLATGVRWANCAYLEWSQIDMRQRIAWIHPDQAKAGNTISVPLNQEAIDVLKRVKGQHDEFVFVYRGAPIGSPKKGFKSACERAGIKNFRWHDIRHTWASWHVQNGTPLAVLKEFGGWHDMSMVMRYAHLAPTHVAHYAENASVRDTIRPESKNVA